MNDTSAPPTTAEAAIPEAFQIDRWLPYRMFLIASRTAELLASYYVPRFGLSQNSWRILAVVGARPGLSSKEICRAAAIDPFAASRGISQLVSLGFARRDAGPGDRRFAAVSLTDEGHRVLAELVAVGEAMERRLEAVLSSQERKNLHEMLDRMEAASVATVARGWEALMANESEDT